MDRGPLICARAAQLLPVTSIIARFDAVLREVSERARAVREFVVQPVVNFDHTADRDFDHESELINITRHLETGTSPYNDSMTI